MRGGKIKYNVDASLVFKLYNEGSNLSQISRSLGYSLRVIQRVFKNSGQQYVPRFNTVEKFWANISKKAENDCWNWTKSVNGKGYGSFSYKSKPTLSHRFAYSLLKGEIPDGMVVCHRCDNPRCCNPNHLFLGTRVDNMQDCKSKGRLKPPQKPAIHPSFSHYRKGCRCQECRNCYRERYEKYKKTNRPGFTNQQ